MLILSAEIGYVILLGVGLFIALVVSLIIKAETKWLGTKKTSDWFSTAGRSVKTGLVSTSIISAWVWAATLLQSSTVAYQFGISGPFWYAAGATIPIVLFGILAMKVKMNFPNVTTFTQIIHQRYGTHSHKVFLFFAILTNTIVTSMLVLGGAAVIHELTGINLEIVSFLIPVGIILYTYFGGLRATFLADYINVMVLFVGTLIFVSFVYFFSPEIGGISGMYEKLQQSAILMPVNGNTMGSFLTMASIGGLIFGVINIVGNLGTVFVDQSYWQRAIAAKHKIAGKAFIIGGLTWFAIPFGVASTLGLVAAGLGIPISDDALNNGLVAPFAAFGILNIFGAILILTMLVTAVTSAGSAQLMAISSLISQDIYKNYINPNATTEKVFSVKRKLVVILGVMMGFLGIVLFNLHLNLQYLYLVMGILIGAAIGPVCLALLWSKTNRTAATLAAVAGLAAGVASWLLSANYMFGSISIQTTSNDIPLLIGNVVSIGIGFAITLLGGLIKSEKFHFQKDIGLSSQEENDVVIEYKKIKKLTLIIPTILVVVIPLSLYSSGWVFSEAGFTLWIDSMILWVVGATIVGILYPILESKSDILQIIKNSIFVLFFIGIVTVGFFSLLLVGSSNHQFLEYYVYVMFGVLSAFGLIVVIMNKKLKSLVKLQTRNLEDERNNLEFIVAQKTDMLLKKEKLASIGQLSARIAHDLRNPLSVLQSTLDILLIRNKDYDEKTLLQYQRMKRAIERMNHQINDVLDYVRVTNLRIEDSSLHDLLSLVLEKIDMPSTVDFQMSVGDIHLECDKLKLEAVFTNLIINAIQAIDGAGKIRIRAVEKNNKVIIEIEDSGQLIDDEIFKKMFTPLFTTKQRGTGLGLVSCKNTVEQHYGTISVKTKPTTFVVILPKTQNLQQDVKYDAATT
jgi:SSS family transporter